MDSKKQVAAPATTKATPSHVYLLARCGEWMSGTVLELTDDVRSALDKRSAKYREASARERAVAGFNS